MTRKPGVKTQKREGQTDEEGARFPTVYFKQHEEHRALERYVINEGQTLFDPAFPEKQRPPKQWLIDQQLLYHKTKDLAAFVKALKDILPFWVKHHHWYRDAATRMTFDIQQRSEPLRQKYNKEHNADIRPCPNDLLEMESWRFDTERAIDRASKAEAAEPYIEPAREGGTQAGGSRRRRRRGRQPLSKEETNRREAILEAWCRAESAGVTRKQFCEDEGFTVSDLENFQAWDRQRKARA